MQNFFLYFLMEVLLKQEVEHEVSSMIGDGGDDDDDDLVVMGFNNLLSSCSLFIYLIFLGSSTRGGGSFNL